MNKKMHNTLSGSKIAVKFLLNQQDAETVDLEAKNMYGETQHMAVKNSSCRSTNLLLDHGAHIETKANV